MLKPKFSFQGLSEEEVLASRKAHGENELNYAKENSFLEALKSLVKEPMVILLLMASVIYFISGKMGDGFFLSSAIVLVAAISLYQDSRSRNALQKLKMYTQPKGKVIRNGEIREIPTGEMVQGDCMVVEEGSLVAADGEILQSNDFSVNESILTGESLSVYKDSSGEYPFVYLGTTVTSGLAIVRISAIGNQTKLGKIGKSLEHISEEKTPLEKQINQFVKKMVIIGFVIFLIVWVINFLHSKNIPDSLLKALTLAMSILPEEIPVAFTTFMALGAWRLMKLGIVVKQMKTVETLGSATVICTDKTGTITENRMSLAKMYIPDLGIQNTEYAAENEKARSLLRAAMWASEPFPFDPMETALHETYLRYSPKDERNEYHMVHEYPLGGKPPMMTHIYEDNYGNRIVACKGAPEAILEVCSLPEPEKAEILKNSALMAGEGCRILGVGEAEIKGNPFPKTQQEILFQFKGLVAFNDPPKKNIGAVLEGFYRAGIVIKMVTGDNVVTTAAIARQIGFRGAEKNISGDELMLLDEKALGEAAEKNQLFSRMFPEAKLKIIRALITKQEIVAMTGDGVNDGPALKAAHIGVAMGTKGSEIAKQAASLILMEDDLSKMVDAVAMGRRIYGNLKKAIRYIISIHIPIVLTVFLPLAFGWIYPNLFSPVHIIFLELVMGPTCSIIYENEPMEKNTMLQPPRSMSGTFFSWRELGTSILQGLMITAGTLLVYQYAVRKGMDEKVTRTMVFTVLISANIFLTLVNRSFYYSVLAAFRYRNKLVPMIIAITLLITGLLLFISPLTRFFDFASLSNQNLLFSVVAGFVSVIWYEGVKIVKRHTKNESFYQ